MEQVVGIHIIYFFKLRCNNQLNVIQCTKGTLQRMLSCVYSTSMHIYNIHVYMYTYMYIMYIYIYIYLFFIFMIYDVKCRVSSSSIFILLPSFCQQ